MNTNPYRRFQLLAISALAGFACTGASAQSNQNYLQWFETEWDDIERRVPDFFLAGYNAVWIPPVSKASFHSPGYDPFDRFDLGQPPLLTFSSSRARTTYGTEATFKAMVDELHQAGGQVYIDSIFNHNNGRTTSDAFLAQGGYPGFWIPREDPPQDKSPTDNWGDFHNGVASGYLQSEDPNGSRYNLHNGDLVALVDISHESSNSFIRQPVDEGNPLNIPAGTIWNKPNANNARFYPDQILSPTNFTNPGTSNNPGSQGFTRYPFNLNAETHSAIEIRLIFKELRDCVICSMQADLVHGRASHQALILDHSTQRTTESSTALAVSTMSSRMTTGRQETGARCLHFRLPVSKDIR